MKLSVKVVSELKEVLIEQARILVEVRVNAATFSRDLSSFGRSIPARASISNCVCSLEIGVTGSETETKTDTKITTPLVPSATGAHALTTR